MSDSERLDPRTEQTFRVRLEEVRDGLRSLLDVNRGGTRPVSLDEPIGRISRIDAIQQQKMAQASRGMQQQRLRLVEAALESMEAGTYGICRLCDEPIGLARLEARPETPFCLDCQQDREDERADPRA
ncbi:MAG: TraR/DksA C4-type zinc finger protein [Acidobacteriota bacterium]|nr:TraR/DksA C4-type zinc finger protein [Acidobacteriota bacterium]MDQ7087657.1 TraR/DksA C4-type zinc finger protein [Acidobacteriota bacterium]